MPAKQLKTLHRRPLRVSTRDLVENPVFADRREAKAGLTGPYLGTRSRDISSKLKKLKNQRELAQAFEKTQRATQSRDYNQFYSFLDHIRGIGCISVENYERKIAYTRMQEIASRYSYDPTLQNKLDEVERLYPCVVAHRDGK